jgi:hypothetical protein
MLPTSPPEDTRKEKSNGGFLEKLQEYKELLTVVVFFLGGFFWIQNQYPTKTDLRTEIGVLNCLLDKYMLLTQLQNKGRDLERHAQELKNEIAAFGGDQNRTQPPLSPAMKQELDDKKADLATVQADLKVNAASIQSTGDELARNVCGKRL